MQYELTKKQIISEANKIRSEFRRINLEKSQKRYIRTFIGKHKKTFIKLIALTAIETLIGISLPIISHLYLEKSFDLMSYRTFMIVGISLFVLIFLYLINSFFRILITQKLTMEVINNIREAWYIYYLKHSVAFKANFDGKKLMTKFLYHIQLLKLGVGNVLSTGIQAVLMYSAILLFSLLFNSKLFIVLWLSLPLFIIIFLITDYIGRHYITREQTFNSRIVAHLADSFYNFSLLKSQGREKEKLKEFDCLIEIDTFFRIRRQLWIEYSNRFLYGIILLVGVLFYFVQIYWPFIEFDSLTNVASTGIILAYFVRVLYSAARIGIFYEAFRLGLRLVIPKFPYEIDKSIINAPKWSKLRIHSKKTKLSKYSKYINNFNFEIEKGKKYLIYSDGPYGKSTLAKYLTGKLANSSILINLDKKRIKSDIYSSYKNNSFYILDSIRFEITIAEYIFGKNLDDISRSDIDKLIEKLKTHVIFDFLFDHKTFIGREVTTENLSKQENIILQTAHCIMNPKTIIAIDHTCLDDSNKNVVKAFEILLKETPETTFVFFSNKPNNLFKYDKTFELNQAEFKEV